MTSMRKPRMAVLMTGLFFFLGEVYQRPHTMRAARATKKKMVPLLKGRCRVLTKKTSKAESTLTMPGIMPQRMSPRSTTESTPAQMNPLTVVLGHLRK